MYVRIASDQDTWREMNTQKQIKKTRGRPSSFDREKLLIQVMELFWDRGFANLSFNEIAQEVGLTRASLYNAFETKEALFLQALKHYFANAPIADLENITADDPVGPAFHKLFKDLAKMYSADHKKRGCLGINCMNELMGGDENLNREVSKICDDIKKRLKSLVHQAITQKELPKNTNVDTTADMILVFMNGFSVISKSKTSEAQLKAMANDFLVKVGFCQN